MESNTSTEKSESPPITENEPDISNEKSNKVVANLNGKIVDTDDNQIFESEMMENESKSKTDETESNEFEETTAVEENKVLEEPKKETELDNIKESTETHVIASNKNHVVEEVKNVSEIAKEVEDNKNIPENTKEKVIKPRKRKVSDKPTEDVQAELKAELADVDIFSSGTSEILGKGKRARIPNKRYSDILMSPSHSRKSTTNSAENGSMDKLDSGNDTDGSTRDEPVLTKKQKLSSDISHPKYLKPFQFGWRRELVWRGTFDENKVRTGDVFYYSPEGKKIKSMKELVDSLAKNKELTTDNFSFAKEVIGIDDPEKEIIREAKTLKTPETLVKHVVTKNTPKSPKLTNQRIAGNKVTSPKLATSPRTLPNKPAFIQTADSSVRTRTPRMVKNNVKMKGPIKKEPKEARKLLDKPPVLEKMEVDQSPSKVTPARRGRKRKDAVPTPVIPSVVPPKVTSKKRTIKLSSITNSEERDENKFMDNYLQNLSYGYSTLLYVFQYLKVQDLLRAGCVCTMWRDIANHPALWRTVRMKNSQVHSFEGLANSLRKHGTRHLDLRKMLLPNGGDEIWPAFSNAIAKVETLRRIELCRCPASVVEKLGESNPQLEVINAVTIKCESMNLEPLKALTEIKELRLKSTGGLSLTSNIDSLREMKALNHLSLTSIRDLDKMNLNVIAELTNLESLDLGECTDFPKNFGGEILIKLTKLEKLRLEKGQGNCHTFEILEAVQQMSKLDQLELVNFDIKTGFDKALGVCQNIRKLLIIPTYISQSATTNHMVLGGVLRLQKTLSHFVWGVTLELLRVTELFVDQCEEPKEKSKKQMGNGDCIPVLKPVPVLLDKDSEIAPALEPPQVEILALPSLQKLLMQTLPTTRVKILKIPFHATWRQSITDSVN